MGKKREKEIDQGAAESKQEQSEPVPVKKTKKHKHKKSTRKEEIERVVVVDDEDVDVSVDDDVDLNSQGLKLKIKLPETSPEKPTTPKSMKVKGDKCKGSGGKKNNKNKKDGKADDDTDSEEERWLDAIESGKLEEVDDELKRMKNPRLMTARQRAMMEKEKKAEGTDENFPIIPAEPLLSLPSGFKEKVVTKEMLAKKAIKTQKRREQAQEKREEDKKKTVDRLLKKQDSKVGKMSRAKWCKKEIAMYSYVNKRDIVCLSVPTNFTFPMQPQKEREKPTVKMCGVAGCLNPKKYSCSKTGVNLCSLQCYKTNMTKLYNTVNTSISAT